MSYNPFSLQGKKVLVTGASSGIGRATAIECSRLGAQVVATGRDADRLQQTMQSLAGEGHTAILADLAELSETERLVAEMPAVDGVVNNAGINIMQPVQFIKAEDLQRLLRVNLEAPIMLTRTLVKRMKINKGGSIVFTASIAGEKTPGIGNNIYSASKGGIISFMHNAALELASKGIRCNAVCPGMIETPLIHKDILCKEDIQSNIDHYPLKRYGRPEEVAYAIVYLLSDASQWVTGSELIIDGGRTLK